MISNRRFDFIRDRNISLCVTTISNPDLEFSTTDLEVTIMSGRTVTGSWRCSERFHAYMLNTLSKEIDRYVTNSTGKFGR